MENQNTGSEEFAVTLKLDQAQAAKLEQGAGVLAIAQALSLDPADPEDVVRAQTANQEMMNAKAFGAELDKARKEFIEPAQLIIERAQARYMPTINALKEAERIIKEKLLAWQTGRKAIADKIQKEADDKARREREEVARREAAERAEREQREKEAREASERAEVERVEAERKAEEARKASDPIALAAAERAARKAAEEKARKLEEEEQLRQETERRARESALAATAAVPPPPPAAEAPKLAGFGSRDNWIAENRDGETDDSVKLKIVFAIAGLPLDGDKSPLAGKVMHGYQIGEGRRELLALLDLDDKAIKGMAKSQKQHTNIPGMTPRNAPIPTSRAKS